MAALTTQQGAITAGFVFNEIWYTNDVQRQTKVVDVTIPTGYGGATNTIAAACFGMVSIDRAISARISASNKAFLAGPSFTGSQLCVYDITNATDASRNTPADTTAATRLLVFGKD